MPGHRAEADRAGRGRRVLPEGQRGRGDGLWRGARTCSSPTRSSAGQKLRRLMGLASTARIGVCADDPAQIARSRGRGRRGRDRLCRSMSRSTWAATAAASSRASRRSPSRAGSRDAPHLRFRRAAGLSRLGAASARPGTSGRQAIAGAVDKAAMTRDLLRANGIACDQHHRRRHRHVRVRGGERRLHRAAMRLVHLHGRRLRPQPRPRRRPDPRRSSRASSSGPR